MIKLFTFLFLFNSLIVTNFEYSKLTNSEQCKKQIKEKTLNINTLSAQFTEKKFSRIYNEPKNAKGVFYFKKSNKIRWEHTEPNRSILLIDGDKIKLKENDIEKNNTKANIIIKRIQKLMVSILDGSYLENKTFTIEYYSNKENYKLILHPKSNKISKYLSKIELIFNQKTLHLVEFGLFENETDKTVYSFLNITENKEIPNEKFNKF